MAVYTNDTTATTDARPNRGERRRQERAQQKLDDREARIREAVELLFEGVIELRVLDGRWVHSGYYGTRTAEGVDALVRDALRYDGASPGIYYTLNVLDQRLLRRRFNRMREKVLPDSTTGDSHVEHRSKLGFDFDVKRPSGTSATDEEITDALTITAAARDWLVSEIGMPSDAIIYGMTGNGGCLLVRVDLPNDSAATALVTRCISAMACQFNAGDVQLDPSVFNASRIWRLPGTIAAKGDPNFPGAPHRRAEILEASAVRVICPRDALERLAALAPAEPQRDPAIKGSFDVGDWIAAHSVAVRADGPWLGDGWRWKLAHCLTDSTHARGEAYIVRKGNGAIAAGCHHGSCTWGWRELREHYEPGCYDRVGVGDRRQQANEGRRSSQDANLHLETLVAQEEEQDNPKLSLRDLIRRPTLTEIEAAQPRPLVQPGVLVRGATTLFSSKGGTGKTTAALQLAAEVTLARCVWGYEPFRCAEQGIRALYINGEDNAEIVHYWLGPVLRGLGLRDSDSCPFDLVTVAQLGWDFTLRDPVTRQLGRDLVAGDYDLVIIDPALAFMPADTEFLNPLAIRGWLRRTFAYLGALTNAAFLVLVHDTKAGVAASGPADWQNFARLVLQFQGEDPVDGCDRISVTTVKSNLGYRFRSLMLERPGISATTVRSGLNARVVDAVASSAPPPPRHGAPMATYYPILRAASLKLIEALPPEQRLKTAFKNRLVHEVRGKVVRQQVRDFVDGWLTTERTGGKGGAMVVTSVLPLESGDPEKGAMDHSAGGNDDDES